MTIDKNRPIPRGGRRLPPRYPFESMKHGDSILVPLEGRSATAVRSGIFNSFIAWSAQNGVSDRYVTTRHEIDGYRFWMVFKMYMKNIDNGKDAI